MVRRLPARAAYRLADAAAPVVVRRGGRGVQRLRANLGRVAPQRSPAQLDQLTNEAMRSYLRYYVDIFRLPDWTAQQIAAGVRTEGLEALRAEVDSGRGVVAGLSHQGNWDLVGAWGVQQLGPLTTVAERLEPAQVYDAFLRFRTGLGMQILPLGQEGLFGTLVANLRAGHIVPLLMDRDLTSTGLQVDLLGHPARMAKGPAMLADVTGRSLFPVSTFYERIPDGTAGPFGSGYRLVLKIHPPVPPPVGNRDARVLAATQACADALGQDIAEHPQDWHMLQRVFSADLGDRAGAP
ncbi:MAG: phosphatidylinositol mannoside acyltransferase [Micrococcales bacterium]|nr:MAG: phosphatidylinositol mannoside acyltransferase [Micrococcales bacterium]PIE27242.1 MAG: phosphatidylinositol mannoside acyltransferase [Micrococcales bacterium]